ncbi:hypothetical protein BGW41_004893 [Actinomortierella wolfii]|nr:hypothetical protein BGW41_004893 [Actinomortierella wolfii]
MGLSKPLTFIAQHILPVFTHDSEHDLDGAIDSHKFAVNSSRAIDAKMVAESAAARRIRQQHPYHPHYQHNLVNNANDPTLSYSTPPSLSSSPTHSSPSSTISSASSAPHSGVTSPTAGYAYPYQQPQYPYHPQVQHPYPYQLQSQQQQHPYYNYNVSRFGTTQTLGPKGGYSYHRHQARYQRRKVASTSYYYVDDEEDMMVGYDTYGDGTYMQEASTPMALPQQQQKQQKQKQKMSDVPISEARCNSHLASGSHSQTLASERMLSGCGEASLYPHQQQQSYRSHLSLLSNNNNTPFPVVAERGNAKTLNATGSVSAAATAISATTATATSARISDDSKATAKHSLRRIAQCSINSDDWCSAKAGQYTRSYADTSFKATSYGEGRRMRRM